MHEKKKIDSYIVKIKKIILAILAGCVFAPILLILFNYLRFFDFFVYESIFSGSILSGIIASLTIKDNLVGKTLYLILTTLLAFTPIRYALLLFLMLIEN